MRGRLSLAAGIAISLATGTAAAGEPGKRFAVVVGANDPGRANLPVLTFADDDAVRSFELLRSQSVDAALLAAPDADTRALYPWAAPLAEPPTRAHLLRTVALVFAKIAEARQAGETVDFYFVYSGHGGFTEGGEGALLLSDGAFTRRDLYEQILARSPADFNHLVVDACDAYFFVSSRGDTDDLDRRLDQRAREYLDGQTLDRFPNTGALLATSRAAQAHEWSEYQGGVFSHQVRSALMGAADADGNGALTYTEVGAFVSAANARLLHPKARLDVFVHPPRADPERALLRSTGARVATLLVERPTAGHLWVEDSRGIRLVESNKSAEQPVRLSLPPRERYYVTLGDSEFMFAAAPGQQTAFKRLGAATAKVRARGSLADALREGLFATPFGLGAVDSYRTQEMRRAGPLLAAPSVEASGWRSMGAAKKGGYGLLGTAALAGAAAVTFRMLSNDASSEFYRALPEDKDRWRERTRTLDWGTTVSVAVLAGAVAAGAGFLLYDWLHHGRMTLTPGPDSLSARVKF